METLGETFLPLAKVNPVRTPIGTEPSTTAVADHPRERVSAAIAPFGHHPLLCLFSHDSRFGAGGGSGVPSGESASS